MFLIGMVAGVFIGAFIGLLVVALMAAARRGRALEEFDRVTSMESAVPEEDTEPHRVPEPAGEPSTYLDQYPYA
jgi:hypothetical protein